MTNKTKSNQFHKTSIVSPRPLRIPYPMEESSISFCKRHTIPQDSIPVGHIPLASVVTTRCQYQWGEEWVFKSHVRGYHVTCDWPMACWVVIPPAAVDRMTDTCENITFPHLRLRVVNILAVLRITIDLKGIKRPFDNLLKGDMTIYLINYINCE